MTPRGARSVSLLLAAFAAGSASAAAYPWVEMASDDVRVVASPRVEVELRLELIRRARRTIDIVTYDQRADEGVALPLGTALREAADRGVRVRFMVSWNSSVMFDHDNKFGRLLVDPPTRTPIEYMIVGGAYGEDEGWGLLDGIHEKFLIVDGELAMTSGRGIGEQYLRWLDTSFAIRGPLVAQVVHCFEAIWRQAAHDYPLYRGYLGGKTRRRAPSFRSTLPDDPDAVRERDDLLTWYRRRTQGAATSRARILHHDFLRQLRALTPTPAELGLDARLAQLKDPVVEALVDRLRLARRVRIATVSAILHPALLDALIAARRRGADITISVNTRAPRLSASRAPLEPSGTVWALEAPGIERLVVEGVKVHAFQIRAGSPWLFQHRKLAIVDDTVFIGSHNYNVPSTAFFDEASLEIEDPRLAEALARRFDQDLANNTEKLDAASVRAARHPLGERLLRWFSAPYLGYM